jgi:MoaA/NifB/PqqE/SkfB family radical SAM enzyme
MLKNKNIDIIWNISLICPWDCQFCCTDAVYVKGNKNSVLIQESGLSQSRQISMNNHTLEFDTLNIFQKYGVTPNAFDIALQDRQARGLELSFEDKVKVIKHIFPANAEIDFSGGDPLACYENFLIMKEASKVFGKDNISVTATGASFSRYNLEEIASVIGKLEFTYDEPITAQSRHRPLGYNISNIEWAKRFVARGVKTKAQLPLHSGNLDNSSIESVYINLHDAGIDELLLMRTFPVGRGMNEYINNWYLTRESYLRTIDKFRKLENSLKFPRVKLQCALKHLDGDSQENPCDLMHKSFGLNAEGTLLLSAWAINSKGKPLDEAFILGNLSKNTLEEILEKEKAKIYFQRLDENFGHCKIFSFVFSKNKNTNALFENNDPLHL